MLAAVIKRPGAVVVRFPSGGAAQAQALRDAAQAQTLADTTQTLADTTQAQKQSLAASERPEQLKILLGVARP